MGEVTEAQKGHIVTELKKLEKNLYSIYAAFKQKQKLKTYSKEKYDGLWQQYVDLFKSAGNLAGYLNKLDNAEPPFNIFQGNLQHANHAMPNAAFEEIGAVIENIQCTYFKENGDLIENPHLNEEEYQQLMSSCTYALNCLIIFRKLVSGESQLKKFRIRKVLDKVIKDRRYLHHHPDFVFNAPHIENAIIYFDREFLYWITMRMLSNAERATYGVETALIRMQTYRHRDGSLYLIVRNNGKTMKERAREALTREGGKSLPNILKMCETVDSGFKLKGFPDHTRACLRLPLAK